MARATLGFDPALIEAIEWWKRLGHTELAIATQALYSLATHTGSPQWIRDSAEAIVSDIKRQKGKAHESSGNP